MCFEMGHAEGCLCNDTETTDEASRAAERIARLIYGSPELVRSEIAAGRLPRPSGMDDDDAPGLDDDVSGEDRKENEN